MRKIEGLNCILLVDDDEATNFLHRLAIRKTNLDLHVQVCNTGDQALDFLQSQANTSEQEEFPKPGIIFLDINMPGMNGWDFLEAYQKLPPRQKKKIIIAMLTVSLNPEDYQKSVQFSDVKAFINKPLTAEKIEDIIHQYFMEEQSR